jgi:hypothetical protein
VADKITRRLAELATIVCVAWVLFFNSYAPSKGSWDDLAVMRAAAWRAPCGAGAPLERTLSAHFEQYGSALPRVDQMRYQKRAELVDSYPLSAALIRVLEHAGRTPLLRNVVIACWLQHVFVVLVVVLLVGWREPWLVLALLVAALAAAYAWPWHWADWLPFQRYSYIWASFPPRGASTLAWFGALVAAVALAGRRRIVIVLALLLLSWLCHRSMAVLCLLASLPPLALLALARRRLRWPPGPGVALALFCGCALLTAGVKLALIWAAQGHFPVLFTASGTGSAAEVRHAGELLLAWALLSLAALELWRRSRTRPLAELDAAPLRETGDTLAWLLGLTAAVTLGLNVAHPPIEVWYGPLFFVWELAMRIGAVPHLLFFALLALTVTAHAPRLVPRLALPAAVLGALLVARELRHVHPRPLPEQRRSLPKLLAKGQGAYADEVQYYLAVGSEVVEQGCAGRTPWSAPP